MIKECNWSPEFSSALVDASYKAKKGKRKQIIKTEKSLSFSVYLSDVRSIILKIVFSC